jgi:pimeloyl-ACP methyl ester carboxylesterase
MSAIYRSEAGARAVRERYLQFLDRWPVPGERLTLPTREGETFVMASGPKDAPALLLFHGSGANATMWMRDVVEWSRHLRVFAVDMIGEPGLSAPSRPPLASEAYALWLDDVMRGLGCERAAICGVSLGGWLALDYATRRPERVERLALLCPGGVGRQKKGWMLFLPLMFLGRWGRRKMRERILGRAPSDASPAMRQMSEFVSLIFANFRPRRDTLPAFSDEALQRLAMPLFVILGGRDVLLDTRETRRRFERNVKQAGIRFIPDAGHLIHDQTLPILEFLVRQ